MKGLLFLARVALICNVLFLACVIMRYLPNVIESQVVIGTMVVLGLLLAPFVNLAANIAYLVVRMRKRPHILPVWLVIANLLFLLFEFFVDFILPS
ncbi:MAG: hypothetical protein ABI581_11550 [Sediminibacterium sp.]